MSLQEQVMDAMKMAMKAKDTVALESLRAIKSALLLQQSEDRSSAMTKQDEIKLLQKLVKQRKDSASIYTEQGRQDLADPELAQVAVIETFLPEPISEEALSQIIADCIAETAASGMKDMGKVVALVNNRAAGRAEGKLIAQLVKASLS
ncbi:MAG: GatB/YqeY domain-containing protein [Bacteroidetes bacterium]|nr:GatB/YqeY domain-containing protein [Bacteroidota bacterium]